jgi:hypothetical protein
MQKPQFAERQYEAAVYIELARGRASPFVPTQNIEAYVGIDAAFDPVKSHAIWRILGVHIPRRMYLSPALWPALPRQFHDEIPGRFSSLFMQFKRPVYQDGKRAKYRDRIGGPYFEVAFTPHQQKALVQLETRVKGAAVVRYASPRFWSRKDFDSHDEKRQVLENSAFIAPAAVKSHRKWFYDSSANKAVLNPAPEDAESERWSAVLDELTGRATRQSLREHIRSLAEQLGEIVEPQTTATEATWLRSIDAYGKFTTEDKELLFNLGVVSLAAESADVCRFQSDWVPLFRASGYQPTGCGVN